MGGLDDQIHVQPRLPQGFEQGCRHARSVRDVGQGDHGLALLQLRRIHGLAQFQSLAADGAALPARESGAGVLTPARADHQGHAVVAGDLHRAGMEHGGPQAGQLQHFVAAHRLHQLGIAHLARIGGEHPGDIGVDLAGIGRQGRRQRHGRGVRAPSPQGGDLRCAAHAAAGSLKTRHHHHLTIIEQTPEPLGADVEDAGPAVMGFGEDPHLGSGHRHGRHALRMQGHRQQGDRHLFACGQQHVHLPAGRIGADRPRQACQLIGGVAHGGDHDHQVMALLAAAADPPGHGLDPFHIGHGGAPELLNQQGHPRMPPGA